jgi:Fe-S cluster assembly ATPase SufC
MRSKKGNQTDTKLLRIENLQVEVEEGEGSFHYIDLEINLGQANVLFGQNGPD